MAITVRELKGVEQLQAIFPLLTQLNKEMTRQQFQAMLPQMLPLGYRCCAAYDGEDMVGICGFWQRRQFWNESSIQLDNLVVDENRRSGRIGGLLAEWVEALARQEGCKMLVLDSYVHNFPSHRFYFRQGYVIEGYHFTKRLG